MNKIRLIRKYKKEGRVLLVSSNRYYDCYFISNNKSYKKLLEELQIKLIGLDVAECEHQDLTVLLETKHANKLIADLFELANVVRCKMIKV